MADESGMGLRERKKLATWRAIRAAALRLIDERDFDAVSLDDIAAAAGVSRSTLFNYFTTKEAIVLDPDPQDALLWQGLMAARPAGEPLWSALREVCLGYLATFSDRLGVQKRLQADSPTLAASSLEHAALFRREVRDWARTRVSSGDETHAELAVSTAQAVMATAYTLWSPDDGFDRLLDLARRCFDQAGRGLAGI